jgi:erythromycin esterase-like protein
MLEQSIARSLRTEAMPLDESGDLDRLMELIEEAPLVLLGEASHGTREFYRIRAEITRRLIVDKGFDAVAVEADWPDALQASRFVQLDSNDSTADQALDAFQRFPQWMWRNSEVVEFLYWLRLHNARIAQPQQRVGFFGLDLYSLRKSIRAVIDYLDRADPEAARRARERYSCFDHMAEDPQHYAYAARFGMRRDCEEDVLRQLQELSAQAASHLNQENPAKGRSVPDTLFYAQQNARVAKNAEAYYRSMFDSRDQSWNVRDEHMAQTLEALREHTGRHFGRPAKIAVWAHNSHLGDARATEPGEHGQLNLGQLVRQRWPGQSFLLGMTTHAGSVTAAGEWDGPAELKKVLPSRPDSIERLLHESGLHRFLLPLRGRDSVLRSVGSRYLERAIGVIYRPESERASHYFHADLANQFDAVIHIDRSSAVRPLEISPHWTPQDELPETFPFGV